MFEPYEKVVSLIPPGARVLDVGGWAEVFPRANTVLDINPYATRRRILPDVPEQFTEKDWYTGDLCAGDIWKRFGDKEFDYVVCSHTLEDVRDPLFICNQMIRVASAGYIEVPSPFSETCRFLPGRLASGYDHHKWIVSVDAEGRLVFTPKMSWANDFDYGGERARTCMADRRFLYLVITWKNRFAYYERVAKGSCFETENLFQFYEDFNYDNPPQRFELTDQPCGETLLWYDQYRLPVEARFNHQALTERYQARCQDRKHRLARWLTRR